jgi:cytochrome P450
MNSIANEAVYYDPYKVEIWKDPYPTFRRMRDEAPLYYNEQYDFYAATRFEDVKEALMDNVTYSNARGNILEIIQANIEVPRGIMIMEDPPLHTINRGALSLLFSPKNMAPLESKIRELCQQCLEPFSRGDRFDFVKHLGAQMPIRVIGMLLGIPEQDLQTVREAADARLRTEQGKPMDASTSVSNGEADFAEYVDWRIKHPSDDIMTQLLNTDIEDETGTRRKLAREEVLAMVTVLAAAGNETTNRLIGWIGKLLAEHPEQRRETANNPQLIPDMIEEVLRFEAPGPHAARYVTRDVELHGQLLPKGSAIDLVLASANRDERRFVDGETFNINREKHAHLTFGKGIHVCLGLTLARLEARIAMEEMFKRFRDWDVDYENAVFTSSTAVRGWDSLPVLVG